MTGSLQIKGDIYYAVLNFKDNHGKRNQRWFNLHLPVKGNKRKAEKMLHELLVEHEGFENIEPYHMLFSNHVANWIEHNRPNISVTTYDQYINILNNHIRPYFDAANITLMKLIAGDLEDYYNFKIQKGLSPNTVIKHHAMMHTALQWAYKHRYIRENIAVFANKPNGDKIEAVIRDNVTKTENSMRTLPLCPYTFQYLSSVRAHQYQMQATCGDCYDTRYLDFVCVNEIGTLLQPDFVTKKFQQVLTKYGLRPIRFHDLRHGCATIMLYLGYSLKDIQTWLGHSNYYFTADTYIHADQQVQHQMAHTLSEKLPVLMP